MGDQSGEERRTARAGQIKPEVEALEIGTALVEGVRQRLVEEEVAAVLKRHQPHTLRLRKLDGEQEAQLMALVCSQPEEGQERWTLGLSVVFWPKDTTSLSRHSAA